MFNAIREKFAASPDEPSLKNDWLAKILGIYGDALPEIRATVDKMMEDKNPSSTKEWTPESRRSTARRVSKKLIKRAAIRTGAMGGITAAPVVFPGIGAVGTAVVGISADFTYLIRKQVWLCYGISAAYDVRMQEDELKAIILAIIGFSSVGRLGKEIAVKALAEMVDVTASRYLRKGILWSASEVAAVIAPRLFRKSYKFIPFMGIPLSASINVASTITVGHNAREYFGSDKGAGNG